MSGTNRSEINNPVVQPPKNTTSFLISPNFVAANSNSLRFANFTLLFSDRM